MEQQNNKGNLLGVLDSLRHEIKHSVGRLYNIVNDHVKVVENGTESCFTQDEMNRASGLALAAMELLPKINALFDPLMERTVEQEKREAEA